jgi:hypothetical protein
MDELVEEEKKSKRGVVEVDDGNLQSMQNLNRFLKAES